MGDGTFPVARAHGVLGFSAGPSIIILGEFVVAWFPPCSKDFSIVFSFLCNNQHSNFVMYKICTLYNKFLRALACYGGNYTLQ